MEFLSKWRVIHRDICGINIELHIEIEGFIVVEIEISVITSDRSKKPMRELSVNQGEYNHVLLLWTLFAGDNAHPISLAKSSPNPSPRSMPSEKGKKLSKAAAVCEEERSPIP